MGLIRDLRSYKTLDEKEQERVKRQVRDLGMMTLGASAALCGAVLGEKLAYRRNAKALKKLTAADVQACTKNGEMFIRAFIFDPDDVSNQKTSLSIHYDKFEDALEVFEDGAKFVKDQIAKREASVFNQALEAALEDK